MPNPRTDIDIPRYGRDEDRVISTTLSTRALDKTLHVVMSRQEHGRLKHVSVYLNYDDVAALILAGKNWLEDQSS